MSQTRRRTRMRPDESRQRNSTSVGNSGDKSPAAFDVFLEIPDGANRTTIKVQVAGLDKHDAAQRARWQVAREKGINGTTIRTVGAYPAGSAGERIPTESPRRAS
jgi:hypothetical protein